MLQKLNDCGWIRTLAGEKNAKDEEFTLNGMTASCPNKYSKPNLQQWYFIK